MRKRAFLKSFTLAASGLFVPEIWLPELEETQNAEAADPLRQRRVGSPQPKPKASTTNYYAVDFLETFEFDILSAANLNSNDFAADGWALTDASSKLSTSVNGSYPLSKTISAGGSNYTDTGTRGLTLNLDAGAIANCIYTFPTSVTTNVSIGFWLKTPALPSDFTGCRVFHSWSGTNNNGFLELVYNSTHKKLRFSNIAGDTYLDVTDTTWYWVTLNLVCGDLQTCTVKLYDTSLSLYGTMTLTQLRSGYNASITKVGIGPSATTVTKSDYVYWDNMMIDWTYSKYPLIYW